jgi:hypothetical protein
LDIEPRNQGRARALLAAHNNEEEHVMSARQFLLRESNYCRKRAAGCADPFIAQELRRLAEKFELTAIAMDSAWPRKIATMPIDPMIQPFTARQGTGYNQGR